VRTVALVTLGCARNEVDSEELAGRLEADGWKLVDDPADAEIALVNTCGFVEQAKKDSVDALLEAASLKDGGTTKAVVAVGCMAERYGAELATALPEADAILGFDDYADISARLQSIIGGHGHQPHTPRDRRSLLPLTPVDRQDADAFVPGHQQIPDLPEGVAPASGPRVLRKRFGTSPTASLKIASGCDRRCSFCAIPSFRGAFVSRRPTDVLQEARWLAENGVKELFLVSENSTSYGKDLGDLRLLDSLLPALADIDGIERIRVSYLQPAEMRPSLLQAMAQTEKVVPYFDLSFQHASGEVLRRMRRFGDKDRFLELIAAIRGILPTAGIRSNFIVGFPGESDADLETLQSFLELARLDAIGIFGYSDEDGTEAATFDGTLDEDEVSDRYRHFRDLAEELVSQRAEDRIGEQVSVLIESEDGEGRAEHQGPDVDGTTTVEGTHAVGDIVMATVVASDGADLIAR
jgi:ribosomal protein S12 methylthiotransferase RimO